MDTLQHRKGMDTLQHRKGMDTLQRRKGMDTLQRRKGMNTIQRTLKSTLIPELRDIRYDTFPKRVQFNNTRDQEIRSRPNQS